MTVFSQFCKSWPKPVTDIIVVFILSISVYSYCYALQTTQTFKLLNIFTVYISHPD